MWFCKHPWIPPSRRLSCSSEQRRLASPVQTDFVAGSRKASPTRCDVTLKRAEKQSLLASRTSCNLLLKHVITLPLLLKLRLFAAAISAGQSLCASAEQLAVRSAFRPNSDCFKAIRSRRTSAHSCGISSLLRWSSKQVHILGLLASKSGHNAFMAGPQTLIASPSAAMALSCTTFKLNSALAHSGESCSLCSIKQACNFPPPARMPGQYVRASCEQAL
mmetsp:Transcript_35233/g.101478  ORF Transcript_35233/g.101478 Transcript_35233/m.101478 type:complete len:219 (+) Transcript_35233:558-1214(+)